TFLSACNTSSPSVIYGGNSSTSKRSTQPLLSEKYEVLMIFFGEVLYMFFCYNKVRIFDESSLGGST
ncbi:MAG: hypothetical protein IKZ74_06600, partial [Clostridiales bacterium]|nr:hypothetical protein [Clostridiales bacterium]